MVPVDGATSPLTVSAFAATRLALFAFFVTFISAVVVINILVEGGAGAALAPNGPPVAVDAAGVVIILADAGTAALVPNRPPDAAGVVIMLADAAGVLIILADAGTAALVPNRPPDTPGVVIMLADAAGVVIMLADAAGAAASPPYMLADAAGGVTVLFVDAASSRCFGVIGSSSSLAG